MPALPPVDHVIRFILKSTYGEDIDMVNRYYFQFTGTGPTAAQCNTLCASVAAAWVARLLPHLNAAVNFHTVIGEDLTSDTAATGAFTGSAVGGDANTPLAAGTAMCISCQIARRYRGGHPRSYVGGLSSEILQDPQTWTAAAIAVFQTAMTNFLNDVKALNWTGGAMDQPANVSYFKGFHNFTFPSGRVRPIPTLRLSPFVDIITAVRVNPKVASQRRRNTQSA